MRGMHQRRESQPVGGPAFHILIVGAAHELNSSHFALFIEILDIQELASIYGRLHEHVVLSALLASLDDLIKLVQAHAHGNGAGAVLSCVERTNRQRRMRRGRRDKMNGVDRFVVQHFLEVRHPFVNQELVADFVEQFPVAVDEHQRINVRMLEVDGSKFRAKRETDQGNSELSVFHISFLLHHWNARLMYRTN